MKKKFKTLYIVKSRDLEKTRKGTRSSEVSNLYSAYKREHELYFAYPQDFYVKDGELYIIGRVPNAKKNPNLESYIDYITNPRSILDERIPLKEFDIIFSRSVSKNRREEITDKNVTTYLSCIKTLYPNTVFINDPDSIAKAGSKIYDSLVLKDVLPITHITKDEKRVMEILHAGKEWFAKPVDGKGGENVIGINKDYKKNLKGIVQMLLKSIHSDANYPRSVIIQEGMEGIERRILLLNGDEILTSYIKIPQEGEVRGNMGQGAIAERYELTDVDKEIVSKVAPILKKDKLYLTALDILGPESKGNLSNTKVLELNVRCPQWVTPILKDDEIEEISDKIIKFSEELSLKNEKKN